MKTLLKTTALGLTAMVMFAQCGPEKTEETTEEMVVEDAKTPTLTMVWETPATLTTCESVLYDKSSGNLYVSNIEGSPTEKDGKGSISIIDKNGTIVNQEWVTGLNAPKGMAISDGKLYVTDIDELVEIDLATAEITNKYPVEGAEFLNDADAHDGKIYFTDMNKGLVHVLDGGAVSTISEGNTSINGVAVASDGTIYGLDGSGLKMINADGSSSMINSTVTGGDGLIILGDGNYVASRWAGEIYFVSGDGETLMLDTKAEESNTADIGFIPEENLVLVPAFMKNKVVAYKLDY
ncbi:SMP-30/gluconolactonase/LRE family protein [Algoriphagus pacificus]|uniref:ATP-binding protein n=1 Tax=Algoriphagus pacificus TaxID=2811234 RepID=A0ABS3CDB6_9BACT|nr:ATP-binding protein [Algoriphagus pacificus]MBN7814997.1 ATP-binding protein [Algoriphagus pacificus]